MYQHGTIFGMGTKDILFPHTLGIVKMQVRKMYHGGAWDPYLPPQLINLHLLIATKIALAGGFTKVGGLFPNFTKNNFLLFFLTQYLLSYSLGF